MPKAPPAGPNFRIMQHQHNPKSDSPTTASRPEGRLINLRTFFVSAVLAALAILGITRLKIGQTLLGIILLALLAVLIIALIIWQRNGLRLAFAFLFCPQSRYDIRHSRDKHRSIIRFLSVLLVVVIVLAAIFSTLIISANWDELDGGTIYPAFVTGIVTERIDVDFYTRRARVDLRDVSVDGTRLRGNLTLTITDTEGLVGELRPGDILSFQAVVRSSTLYDHNNGVNNFGFRRNLRYRAWITESDITPAIGSPSLGERMRRTIHERLYSAMPDRYAAVAFGMLVGDRQDIDRELQDAFGIVGLGHILSVSGIHIMVLLSGIGFLLKLILKHKRRIRFHILIGFALLYAYIASFSPSVMRAVIMTAFGGFSLLGGSRRDSLNTLGFASSCMLVARPLWLFDAGFLMSASSVLAIIFFAPAITRAVSKPLRAILKPNNPLPKRLPGAKPNRISLVWRRIRLWIFEWLSPTLGVSLAAKIGIAPVAAIVFTRFATYSVFVGTLLLPVLALLFSALFVGLIISLIFPFLGVVAMAPATGGIFVVEQVTLIAVRLPGAEMSIFPSVLASIIVVICFFLISRFFILHHKRLVTPICLMLILFLGFSGAIPHHTSSIPLMIPMSTAMDTIFVSDTGQVIAVSSTTNRLPYYLTRWHRRRLDALFVYDISPSAVSGLLRLGSSMRPRAVYSVVPPDPITLTMLMDANIPLYVIDHNITAAYGSLSITPIVCSYSTPIGFVIRHDNTDILIPHRPSALSVIEPQRLDYFGIIRITSLDDIRYSPFSPNSLLVSTELTNNPLLTPPNYISRYPSHIGIDLMRGAIVRPSFWL